MSSAHFRAVVDTVDLSDNRLGDKQNDRDRERDRERYGDRDGDGDGDFKSLIVRKSLSDYS